MKERDVVTSQRPLAPWHTNRSRISFKLPVNHSQARRRVRRLSLELPGPRPPAQWLPRAQPRTPACARAPQDRLCPWCSWHPPDTRAALGMDPVPSLIPIPLPNTDNPCSPPDCGNSCKNKPQRCRLCLLPGASCLPRDLFQEEQNEGSVRGSRKRLVPSISARRLPGTGASWFAALRREQTNHVCPSKSS